MPDIRLVQQTASPPRLAVTIDWLLQSTGTLDDTQALASAVIMALGTDRLALPSDTLPGLDDTDRRGWWGDLEAEEIWQGWPVGTRLWLLKRDKITDSGSRQGATVTRVEQYIREALQPFIEKRIASSMKVTAARSSSNVNRIDATVTLFRGPTPAVDLRYAVLWDELQEA